MLEHVFSEVMNTCCSVLTQDCFCKHLFLTIKCALSQCDVMTSHSDITTSCRPDTPSRSLSLMSSWGQFTSSVES